MEPFEIMPLEWMCDLIRRTDHGMAFSEAHVVSTVSGSAISHA
jgi:hypothetical protein